MVNHVLSRFSKTDAEVIDGELELVADQIDVLIKDGMGAFSGRLGMLLKK